LLNIIDEELVRLPERYRAPLLLCYIEGKTRDVAARKLGWSGSTLQRRLEQGRERLRVRLRRRGITLPAAFLTLGAVAGISTASVPPALLVSTVKTGALGAGIAGAAPAVKALAEGATQPMAAIKLRAAAFLLGAAMILGVVASAGSWPFQPAAEEQTAQPKQQPLAGREPLDNKDAEATIVTGRVEEADGKPVGDAPVAVLAYRKMPARADEDYNKTHLLGRGKSKADGTFRVTFPRLASDRYYGVQVVAGAPGHAIAYQEINADAERPAATLRLDREQILHVRLVGLQGEPVAKAKVALSWTHRKRPAIGQPVDALSLWPGPFITDDQGRFTVRGLSADDAPYFDVRDSRYAYHHFSISPEHKDRAKEVTIPLPPPRFVSGRVTAEDTGKPLAGARILIQVPGENFYGKTDAEGHYEVPITETRHVSVYITPPAGSPCLTLKKSSDWPRGMARHALDFALPRGVVVRGSVREDGTDKPVPGATVEFFPQRDNNPNFREDVACLWQAGVSSQKNGRFEMVLPPGASHLLVTAPNADYFYQEIAYSMLAEGKFNPGRYSPGPEGNAYYGGQRVYVHGLVKLELATDATPDAIIVKLRRGVTVKGRLLDADGKPVARAVMASRLIVSEWEHIVRFSAKVFDGKFALRGCDPKQTYRVFFLSDDKQQGAVADIAGDRADEPVTVRLAPCGTATARLMARDGKPYAKRRLVCDVVITPGPSGMQAKEMHADLLGVVYLSSVHQPDYPGSDAEGCFTMRALIPGATYRFYLQNGFKDCTAEAGKSLDWGDIADPVLFAE
jgi:protocatechuate 3,4-dioxygenase beta subunit